MFRVISICYMCIGFEWISNDDDWRFFLIFVSKMSLRLSIAQSILSMREWVIQWVYIEGCWYGCEIGVVRGFMLWILIRSIIFIHLDDYNTYLLAGKWIVRVEALDLCFPFGWTSDAIFFFDPSSFWWSSDDQGAFRCSLLMIL